MAIEDLGSPEPSLERLADPPVSRLMFLLWRSRDELREAFALQTPAGQAGLVGWYRAACASPRVLESAKPHSNVDTGASSVWVLSLQRCYRVAIATVFRLGRMTKWLPGPVRTFAKRVARRFLGLAAQASSGMAASGVEFLPSPGLEARRSKATYGANLVGHVRGELGLGQHLRYTAAAFSAADIPFGLVDFPLGVPARQRAVPVHGLVREDNPYRSNVFLMSPGRILDAFCYFGEAFFTSRFNVLYAVWELSLWPEPWREVLELFDEIWVPTRFVENSVRKLATCPVVRVPLCIELPATGGRERATFGLSEGKFVFLVVVDAFSFLERKNPLAAVRAFKQAFAVDVGDVTLVIKAMNVNPQDAIWRQLLAECRADSRIVLMNRSMLFDELIDLYRCVDCLVSLHRAEGFGMCVAEAMHLGKPVIVTNYSGTTDFARPENACLVDFRLVSVDDHQYPFARGQVWADPDVVQAADYMRLLHADRAYARRVGGDAAAAQRASFAPRLAGAGYADQLLRHGPI